MANAILRVESIVCANTDCKKRTVKAVLHKWNGNNLADTGDAVQVWTLLPDSSERLQPDYIPAVLREDYSEACKIRSLSPKASATLARRCLQGMIRDFCGISKNRLVDEIKELKDRVESGQAPRGVTEDTIDAIDAVRSVGNIGAHMEKDINVIVEIDAGEAQALIGLIELLFEEWYVARHNRQEKLEKLKLLAEAKKAAPAAPPKT